MKNTLLKIGIAVSPFLFLLTGVVGKVQAEPYGWSPQVDFSNQGPPTCTDAKPKAPILYQPNHPLLQKAKGKGQIRLQWVRVPGASNYSVFYGLTPKNYIYSSPDVGNTDNFTVGYLANKVYYFAVTAKAGCAGSKHSNEWAGRPGAGGVVLAAAGFKPVKKTTAPAKVTQPTVLQPTQTPSVKGVQTQNVQPTTYQAPQYNPPVAPPAAVPVTPKPKGFWETLLSILFGK
ncbi:hypothetical protein HZB96_04835 [Candidatus Gottesmanbacteria bacterium]|nr:hypothetical protein [Candidatus Gottesmanbacteria bacterium]MBI5452739.1 hypothetical protein [Candidatus Gottesmanbacteria bacterium]